MSPLVRDRLNAEWLTTDELAAYTGWSTTNIKQKAHRGVIDSVKKGDILLFWKGDFSGGQESGKAVTAEPSA